MDPNSKDLTWKDYVDMRLATLHREMELRMEANEDAINKANAAMDYRLESMNEFRSSMKDQSGTFATRRELEAIRESLDSKIDSLSRQVYLIVGALVTLQVLFQYWVNQ